MGNIAENLVWYTDAPKDDRWVLATDGLDLYIAYHHEKFGWLKQDDDWCNPIAWTDLPRIPSIEELKNDPKTTPARE